MSDDSQGKQRRRMTTRTKNRRRTRKRRSRINTKKKWMKRRTVRSLTNSDEMDYLEDLEE